MATINVDEATREDLKTYCKKQGITQGDFVKYTLAYFRKSGINPADPPESVKEEIAKVEKRVSQLIGFQKTFERDNLLPLLEALTKTEGKIDQHFSTLPEMLSGTLKEVTAMSKLIANLEQAINRTLRNLFDQFGQKQETIVKQYMDMTDKLNIIMEHGAAVGMTGNSIIDRHRKQKK
ncbi:MAG: BfmA/BtgA family mobilization protein [Alphaproteobacteria bacterium]